MRAFALALAASLCSTAVMAQPQWPDHLDVDLIYRAGALLEPGQRWDFRLGAGAESESTFQGSADTETEGGLFLVAAYRDDWGNLFLAGDGLGYSTLVTDRFAVLLQLEAEDTREQSDDARLRGLGDQDEEIELEIVGQYLHRPWRFGGSVAAATGDKGVVWFIGGGYAWRLAGERLFLNLGADLSGSDKDNQQTDFGITPAQSAASVEGFPVYAPDGGLKSFGLRLNADYEISRRWYLYGEADYERLLGDVADSPLVQQGGSENNYEVGFGAYYRF